ncbi:ferritin-like domain-containing protein [Russula earlei]|uniref:Ferritin-like domain-containing protein n=1 Tax=Russula earlei TaxID=71964 RepID=A0ACC0U6M1_9AGAM|nr:ferritin-like domain-containing protein [Russula earlei]
MRFATLPLFTAVLAPFAVSAIPMRRGTDNSTALVLRELPRLRLPVPIPGIDDPSEFAFVLEQLEAGFYSQALSKFQASDFISAGFSSANIAIEELTVISTDESSHVSAIEEILIAFGETPLTSCQFDFSSVLTDVSTMATVARVVENVGVGAYLGAAHLIQDPRVLTAAASIVTIEARHQTILNIFQGGSAIPQSFDIPLLPQEVLAIAGSFISGCDLGVTPNPALSVTNTGSITVGTLLEFSSSAINGSTDNFHCQMLAGGMPFSISLPIGQCIVPAGINGPVAVWVTSDDQPLNGGAVDRISNAIVAGPLMAFIDTQPETLSSLVRADSNSTAITTTVSLAQAELDRPCH